MTYLMPIHLSSMWASVTRKRFRNGFHSTSICSFLLEISICFSYYLLSRIAAIKACWLTKKNDYCIDKLFFITEETDNEMKLMIIKDFDNGSWSYWNQKCSSTGVMQRNSALPLTLKLTPVFLILCGNLLKNVFKELVQIHYLIEKFRTTPLDKMSLC